MKKIYLLSLIAAMAGVAYVNFQNAPTLVPTIKLSQSSIY